MSKVDSSPSARAVTYAAAGDIKTSSSQANLAAVLSPHSPKPTMVGGTLKSALAGRRRSADLDDIPHVSQQLQDANLPARTKIICTLGPTAQTAPVITKLVLAGMNVARFNLSHGDYKYHEQLMGTLREVLNESKRVCATLADTHGPEIRTRAFKEGKDLALVKGQTLVLSAVPGVLGDKTKLGVTNAMLISNAKVGSEILLDYGLVSLLVTSVDAKAQELSCTVQNSAVLGTNKKVHLPGVVFADLKSIITEHDVRDVEFAVKNNMDFVALSYVRNAADVKEMRDLLAKHESGMKIFAKIENRQSMENFDEILAATDGILISRGDLGVEIPIEQVSLEQKHMIGKCNAAGKPVITATQMLDSMIKNPSPTRAEASDVANAVLDGTDCVMLTGETANGKWPVQATTMMADICREAESATNYRLTFQALKENVSGKISVSEAIASSAVKASFDLQAALVIVLTESGFTARLVSKYRPNAHILTITSSEQSARQCLVSRGLFPLLVSSMSGTASLIRRAIVAAEKLRMCKMGDLVIITSGQKEGVSGNTNDLKIVQVQF